MTQFLIKNPFNLEKTTPCQYIDCTYYLPNEEKIPFCATKTIKHDDIFFDVDSVADTASPFGHTFPPHEIFLNYCIQNGINYGTNYIFYDHKGIFSAPRVYFTFLAYGFKNIFVLDGGYPAFEKMNHVNQNQNQNQNQNNTNTALTHLANPIDLFVNSDYVAAAIQTKNHKIIDARPSGRFHGTMPEPRDGLESGHIPSSINLPFTDLLTSDKTYKSVNDITNIFTNLGINQNDTLIFSCGSGITACVVAFGALMCGFKADAIKIYDASWCEWGNGNFKIERT